MKNFYSVLFVLVAIMSFGSQAFASVLEVSPKVVYRNFDDADAALGVGVEAGIKEVFPAAPQVGLIGGFEHIGTEVEGIDGQMNTVSAGVGYDFNFNAASVRPYLTLDYAFISADEGFDASNEIGWSLGVRGEYAISQNISVFAGLGYQWLDTTVSYGPASAVINLDNFNLQSGLSFKF